MEVEPVLVQLGTLPAGKTFVFNGDPALSVWQKTDREPNATSVECLRLSDGQLHARGKDEGVIVTPYKAVKA
ncbi:MAG: hypothetical protein KIS92_00905 [Planctomycetota bacterium]|nr:hypothetical protein [Planctomycetota bacterium]